jgi:hypothetical protein
MAPVVIPAVPLDLLVQTPYIVVKQQVLSPSHAASASHSRDEAAMTAVARHRSGMGGTYQSREWVTRTVARWR